MRHNRWRIFPPLTPEGLTQWPDLDPLVVQILHNRGLTEYSQGQSFLAADERLLHDPFLLPEMDRAVARLYQALLRGEVIAIYGDFDTDGITATLLLTQGLSLMGGRAIPYIPHRLEEGYSLNLAALEALHRQGVSLIITADCGISALPEVEQARRMGLEVIITDHHTVPPTLPPALAAVDPQRPDSRYPFPGLAGVGVAFKLLQALFKTVGREEELGQFLDLVALGTVADMAPLLGENRYLVKRGLEVINRSPRLGLGEMMASSGLRPGAVDTESISYTLGPRLNAAGRLDHAILSYQLLAATSPEEARNLARLLETKNTERQRLTLEVMAKVKEKIPSPLDRPLLLVGGEDYPAGVVGVVAGKLAEEFYRPAIVLEIGPQMSRGSARSIPEFNIIAALTQCRDLFSRFGGHPQAAGFTLPTANLPLLEERLLEVAEREIPEGLRPTLAIDAELSLSSLSGETLKALRQLEPFGRANPTPAFLSRGVRVLEQRTVGNQGNHLRLKLRDNEIAWHAIGFRLGELLPEVTPYVDIVYNLGAEEWRGRELLQLNLLDLAPAGLRP